MTSVIGVFNDYDGSDFCSGLYFGAKGAGMLTDLATLFKHSEHIGLKF